MRRKAVPTWMHMDRESTIAMLRTAADRLAVNECPHYREMVLVNIASALEGSIAHAQVERDADRAK